MVPRLLVLPLILALTAVVSVAHAEESPLSRLVAEVLERNPGLRAGALRRGAYRREAQAADIYPDPTLAVMVDRVAMGVEMPMIRYQLSQMFPWPGKLGLRRDAGERQGDGSAAELEVRRLDLRLEAKRGYFMLLLNTKRREVNRASRSLAATIASATLARYGAGLGGHHDVARAQVEVTALDVELVNLEGERTSIVAMLNALRDRSIETTVAEPSSAPSPAPADALSVLVERALSRRPELKGMGAMRGEAQAMARLARKEAYPDLMGSIWLNQNIGAPASFGGMVGGILPVFGVTRQRHRAAAFDARAEGAAEDQAAMRAMIRFEITDASTRVQTATRQLDLLRTVARPKARESFQASLAGYGAATVDILGLLDARRALQAMELAIAEAHVNRELALVQLERAVGAPFPGEAP
ncbi:MAG: TolC family protein [Minicystis sp.]